MKIMSHTEELVLQELLDGSLDAISGTNSKKGYTTNLKWFSPRFKSPEPSLILLILYWKKGVNQVCIGTYDDEHNLYFEDSATKQKSFKPKRVKAWAYMERHLNLICDPEYFETY
ncbi:hypothetical protein [Runella sp.]|uniref:hypothetical protein n=1 Tax=Runella sp. TaxID=1960881 RepID=UPI003D0F86F9